VWMRVHRRVLTANLSRGFLVLTGSLALLAVSLAGGGSVRAASASCPRSSKLVRPTKIHDAVPAARAFARLGERTRVRVLEHGPRSVYAAAAKRVCGRKVLRLSVYVQLHPRGVACQACDLRAFLVHLERGPWRVWTTY
jgi:dihydrodipicolinate synthase/N-acetylneuraminate lyase